MFQINDWGDIASLVAIGSFILGSFYGISQFIEQVNQLAKTVKEIDDSSSATHKRIFDVTDHMKHKQHEFENRLNIVEHDLKQAGITTVPNDFEKNKNEGDDT